LLAGAATTTSADTDAPVSNDTHVKSLRGGCDDCPADAATRRAFLRDVGRAVIGALALSATIGPFDDAWRAAVIEVP
jgi:hypothetical protein